MSFSSPWAFSSAKHLAWTTSNDDFARARVRARAAPLFRSDKSEVNRLKYVIETLEEHARELATSAREANEAKAQAEDALEMYVRRLKESEKDVFKLEKALEEKTALVETSMAIARRQIKYTEEKMREAMRERDMAIEARDEAMRRGGSREE